MIYVIIFISLILIILGVSGSIIPFIPGPPLAYIALIILQIGLEPPPFSISFLIIFGILTLISSTIDNILPILGAQLYGASKYGIWGAIIGMIIGTIFFPPLGMIIGILIGAVTGELIAGKHYSKALTAGFASFVASIIVIILRFSVCMMMAYYYFKSLIQHF